MGLGVCERISSVSKAKPNRVPSERTKFSQNNQSLSFRSLSAIVLALCIFWNWQFVLPQAQFGLMQTPDVTPLIEGFHNTPHLWPDSLRWWHGAWQYPGIPRFRPLSGYLYWFECWIGLKYGWVWTGAINFIFFVVCCLTTTKIVQRFTGSLWAALVAGGLAAAIRFFNSGTPYWLIWFPNAYNLLTASLWLGALLAFDCWHEGIESYRKARWLLAAWGLFIAACLSLESAWMFPAMAFLIAALRPSTQPRWKSLLQSALMCGAVGFLAWYRARVVPSSTLPNSDSTNFGSIFFTAHPLVLALRSEDWALLGLCAFIGLLCVSRVRQEVIRTAGRLAPPVVWIGIIAIGTAALFLLFPDAISFVYRLAYDPMGNITRIVYILALPFGLFLLWRYGRVIGPTWLVALCLPPLAILPTLPYTRAHWHYSFTSWFFLCIFYGTMTRLVELHYRRSAS